MRIANIAAAIIGMLFSTAAFLKTLTFKQFTNVPVGPEFFPRWIAIGLFACCLFLLIQNILKKDEKSKAPTISPLDKNIQRMLVGIAIVLAGALLWNIAGFIPVSIITIFSLCVLLGKRNWLFLAAYSVLLTALIFMAFRFLLGIEMPLGLIGNLF